MATFTILGTGAPGTNTTWGTASSIARPGVAPAGGGLLIAVGWLATDGGSQSGGSITSTGWTGTAPTWSTPVTVHTTGTIGLVVAYSTNAYSGSGSVTAAATESGDNVFGCSVVEITNIGGTPTFVDSATAAGASTANLDPQGDLNVWAFYVYSTTAHGWTGATELFETVADPFTVTHGSFAYDDSSPVDASATPTTGNRCIVGLAFTVDTGGEAQDVTPAAQTVEATPGTVTLAVDIPLVAPTVDVTPGTVTVSLVLQELDLTGPTVDVTPGTLAISGAITPDPTTVDVTPGTVTVANDTGGQDVTPAPETVAVTAGAVALSIDTPLTGPTVTVTAGTASLSIDIPLTGPTVTATAGTASISVDIPLTGPMVGATAGTLTLNLTVALVAPGVTVTAGTVTVQVSDDVNITGPTVGVTPGSVVVARATVLGVNCGPIQVLRRVDELNIEHRTMTMTAARRAGTLEVHK